MQEGFNPRIVLVSNSTWSIAKFRCGLIRHLMRAGYEVIVVAQPDVYVSVMEELGCRFVPLPMDNQGTNIVKDFALLCKFIYLFRNIKPKVFLGFTVKPNIYGSLAAQLLRIPTICNVPGLGTAFIRENWVTRLVEMLYRLAFWRTYKVFFQNADDQRLFVSRKIVPLKSTDVLPGSGVDTAKFSPVKLIEQGPRPFRFLLFARLLWAKGVGEYVEAARIILKRRQDVEFQILGYLEVENRTAISRAQMEEWEGTGVIRYLGEVTDVQPVIAQADCIVLPSYREGTPRSLLEAASMGKPIVTTDAVGCRDVVDDGLTGYLCRPRDAFDLANKMDKMLSLSPSQRIEMGLKGRQKMMAQFNEQIVIHKYLEILSTLKLKNMKA